MLEVRLSKFLKLFCISIAGLIVSGSFFIISLSYGIAMVFSESTVIDAIKSLFFLFVSTTSFLLFIVYFYQQYLGRELEIVRKLKEKIESKLLPICYYMFLSEAEINELNASREKLDSIRKKLTEIAQLFEQLEDEAKEQGVVLENWRTADETYDKEVAGKEEQFDNNLSDEERFWKGFPEEKINPKMREIAMDIIKTRKELLQLTSRKDEINEDLNIKQSENSLTENVNKS